MNRLRAWIRSFFAFSRADTNGFLILLPLLVVLIFSEPIYRYWFVRQPIDFTKEKTELDSLMATWKWEPDSAKKEITKKQLFQFDPNLASKEDLIELGFNPSLANRIVNYRTKGGKFVRKNDLMKIYGMDSALYQKIYPFIMLSGKIEKEIPEKKIDRRADTPAIKFDLNTADTSQLIKVYGIGPKLSQRIINYRDKLGGFVSASQLNEVYGLDSIVVRELFKKSYLTENFKPRLVDINHASEKDLAAHPYIKNKIAKAITVYRFQHGAYSTVDDLKKLALIDDAMFQKIKPYLSANP